MSYALHAGVTGAISPPIADVQAWLDGVPERPGQPLLDVAQAVPVEAPAPALLQHVARALAQGGLHRYTPIRGLPELCEALAAHMQAHYGGAIDARQVVITAGCNQAFCSALRALVGAGDEVLLPVPYYFNHQMWLDMLGARAVHVPFDAAAGGIPTLQAFADAITPRTRVIVVVSPNNPTGAVYPDALLEGLFDLARAHGLALVLDETYKDFHPAAGPPHRLFQRPDWGDVLVQLFSFSKSYSLTGYRCGSVIAGPALVEQVTKVQDCVSICAPRVAQVAALYALAELDDWVRARAAAMATRIDALRAALAPRPGGFELICAGAWFAYVAHPFTAHGGHQVARWLAREHALLCVPGSMFGPRQSPYLRFAFANLEAAQMPTLAARLEQAGQGALAAPGPVDS